MYEVHKLLIGKTVSILKDGYPNTVVLDEKTEQRILEFLHSQGMQGITLKKTKNGDN